MWCITIVRRQMDNRERIEELRYGPAINVACDEDGPISGETTVCSVPYTFARRPDDFPGANEWGVWYDLFPIDLNSGLMMRAMGKFRTQNSVSWTLMGSPILFDTTDIRSHFRTFINRLIDETATDAHWASFCVNHYNDPIVEDVRRRCVGLFCNRGSLRTLNDKEVAELQSLLTALSPNADG